ncbi:MAG: ImmA/IrrE family metallo-endopeptidase [bacterium]
MLEIVGREETVSKARSAASHVRHALSNTLEGTVDADGSAPLSWQGLKEIARAKGIVSIEFNVPMVSEGRLLPLKGGGFKVDILRSQASARARFSLAHEIGHTFFYDLTARPATRRESAASLAQELEERFCDEFAAQLLFPCDAVQRVFGGVPSLEEPCNLMRVVEATSREWSVSVETVLRRLNECGSIKGDVGIFVLRDSPHFKTGRDPALRVKAFFPRPSRGWFVPKNRRARSVGLDGAGVLYEHWLLDARGGVNEGRRGSGVLSMTYERGVPVVFENEKEPRRKCTETIEALRKPAPEQPWRRVLVEADVVYRLYASSTFEAYVVAVATLHQSR